MINNQSLLSDHEKIIGDWIVKLQNFRNEVAEVYNNSLAGIPPKEMSFNDLKIYKFSNFITDELSLLLGMMRGTKFD